MDRLPAVLRSEFLAVGIVPFNLVRMYVVVATTINFNQTTRIEQIQHPVNTSWPGKGDNIVGGF